MLTPAEFDLPYDFDSIAAAGSMLGSGAIIVIDDSVSIVDVALRTAKFYKHESCGKCTPCREGTSWTVKMLQRVDDGLATPMDLDIIESVCEQIMGNCLCVLGDAMAMPVSSMVKKFRPEFEAHIEAARSQRTPLDEATLADELDLDGACRRRLHERRRSKYHVDRHGRRRAAARLLQEACRRARARQSSVFTIDGAEVRAPEGLMLVDAAKYGGVEIPVFCYEPKLGAPVGACRMCLVEIEGIPKLQTACSTPVRDGMSVITKSPRVIEAQNSVVEFILANHPLDCPVCDKGGECPLQDISYGWGRGKSRFTEPKRHFEKPVALSPSDRDRPRALHPLLSLRALLPGGQRGLPVGAARARRRRARRHLRRHRVHRAVLRQHHRALPRRRADQPRLPLPRPPVGHRAGRIGLFDVPGPVQRRLHRARREGHARARSATTHAVDDGWLCDRGRFAYQAWESEARITQPLVRQGDKLLPARWDYALDVAAGMPEEGRRAQTPRWPAAARPTKRAGCFAA